MNIEGTFPKDLEERGLLDKEVLRPSILTEMMVYFFTMPLKTTSPRSSTTSTVGSFIYFTVTVDLQCSLKCASKHSFLLSAEDESKISSDEELQNWIKELSTPALSAGSGIKVTVTDITFHIKCDLFSIHLLIQIMESPMQPKRGDSFEFFQKSLL